MNPLKWTGRHLMALVMAAAIGGIIGAGLGIQIEWQYLLNVGMLQRLLDAGLYGPFIRIGTAFAALGAVIGAAAAYVLKLLLS
jgi:hypothetical protein